MNAKRMARLALALALAAAGVLPASAGRAGDDAPPAASPAGLAGDLDRAFRDDGPDAFRRRAAAPGPADPFDVLRELLGLVRARHVPPGDSDRSLLAAFGAPDAAGGLAPGIAQSVEGWLAAGADAFEAEARLADALAQADGLAQSAGAAAALERLRKVGPAELESPLSLTGPSVRLRIANLLAATGDPAGAIALAAKLRDEAKLRGWPLLEARALGLSAGALRVTGRAADALAAFRDEAAIRVHAGERDDYIAAEQNRASLALQLGSYREAEAAAANRVAAAEAAHRPLAAADSRLVIAIAAARQRRFDEAEDLIREVLRVAASAKDAAPLELHAMSELASLLVATGRLAEALALTEAGLARPEGAALPLHRYVFHFQRAQALMKLRLREDSMRHLEAALALVATPRYRAYRTPVLQVMARIDESYGRTDAARRRLEECLAIHEASKDRANESAAATLMCAVFVRAGDARGAMPWADRSLAASQACGRKDLEAAALIWRAAALQAGGDAAAAVTEMERAVTLCESVARPDRAQRGRAEQRLGEALAAAGRPADAIPHLRRRTEALLDSPRGITEETGTAARGAARDVAASGTAAAFAMMRADPARAAEALETAWWFEEATRTRLLLDTMGAVADRRRESVPEDLARGERVALADLVAAQRGLVIAASDFSASGAPLAAARDVLANAHARLRDVDAKIALATSTTSSLASASPVGIRAVRERLDADTAVLTYSLAGKDAYLLVVTNEGGAFLPLGSSQPIVQMVQAWLELASTPDGPEAALAEKLHAAVLAPAAAAVGARSRLLIVPDGALTYVPFEALVDRKDGRPRRAVERFEIAYEASATVHHLLANTARGRPAAKGVVALGDPVPLPRLQGGAGETVAALRGVMDEFGPLPGSGAEARTVASLYPEPERTLLLGADATAKRLLDASAPGSAPLRVLHVACHAFVDGHSPRLSGLMLSGGDVLNVETLYRSRISADLAVLSACETAGGEFADGEGVIGLTRGFFVAGVPRVVVSAWRVPDDATQGLMRAFHERMVSGNASPAAALRAAKLAALRAGGAAAHPYRWASFVLWGLQ